MLYNKWCIFYLSMILSVFACKTSQPIVSGTSAEREVSLYSSGDTLSTIRPEQDVVRNSIKNLEKKLQQNPRSVDALVSLAELHYVKGDTSKAEELAKKALAFNQKSAKARFVLAKCAYSSGKYPLAEMIIEGINASEISESQIYNLKGLIALNKADHSLAFHFFKLGLEKDPQDISIRMNLGVLYLNYKQLASAVIEFERVLKIVPTHSDAQLHLSIAKLGLGQLDQAEVLAKGVVSNYPKNPIALYQMAYIEYKKGQYEESSEWLQKYVESVHHDASKLNYAYQLGEKIRMNGSKTKGISNEEINALASRLNTQKQDNSARSAQMLPKEKIDKEESRPAARETKTENVQKNVDSPQKLQVGDEIQELESILEK